MDQSFSVYTDGGSRGNPGSAAAAFLIFDEHKHLVHKEGDYLGIATNNEAEYQAVILALEAFKEGKVPTFDKSRSRESSTQRVGTKKADFFLDSMLVVKQINGQFKVKDLRMQKLCLAVNNLIKEIGLAVSFTHIRREQNKDADALVNEILDNELKK
jgi:ribonuclease HI